MGFTFFLCWFNENINIALKQKGSVFSFDHSVLSCCFSTCTSRVIILFGFLSPEDPEAKFLNMFQKCLIVFGGFLAYFLADGYTYSIGIFYSHLLNKFGTSGTSTAVLPGLLYAIPQISSLLLCPMLRETGYSSGAAWGALLLSLSCLASAFTPNMQLLYLTLGVFASLGLQLTYASAIMAVTTAFSNTKIYGLALGLIMCGSGIGSFVFNPLAIWLLDTWTWRGAMIIQSGILLNVLVSSACFRHADVIHFRPSSGLESDRATEGDESVRSCEPNSRHVSLFSLYNFCFYVVCIPVHLGFASRVPDKQNLCETCRKPHPDFCGALALSLRQIVSPKLWRNATLVLFIIANGLIGAAIVVPWTFIYDYLLVSVGGSDNLDSHNADQIAWLPSLIGVGSLFGQLIVGFLTSQFGQVRICCCVRQASSSIARESSPSRYQRSSNLRIFVVAALWCSMMTFLIAFLPVNDFRGLADHDKTLLSQPIGQTLCAACLLLGLSFGAVYVLYPQILMDLVGLKLWAAALGLLLTVNGIMNLIGTSIGGFIFDRSGSYLGAFILASILPLLSTLLIAIQLFFFAPISIDWPRR